MTPPPSTTGSSNTKPGSCGVHVPLTPTVTREISLVYLPEQRQTACARAFVDVLRAVRA